MPEQARYIAPRGIALRVPGSNSRSPLWALLFVAALALPSGATFYASDFLLTPYRIFGMVAAIAIVGRLVLHRDFRWNAADLLIVFYSLWVALSFLVNQTADKGYKSAGVMILECAVPYFIGRVYVFDATVMARISRVGLLIAAILIPFTLVEAISGQHFVQALVSTNTQLSRFGASAYRYGLLRAMGTFDHPILYGLFCASQFSLAWYSLKGARLWLAVATVFVSVFLSLSAGPVTALAVQIALIAWDRMTTKVQFRWHILVGVFAVLFILLELFAKRSPLALAAAYLTIDPGSGWVRILQWNIAWPNVERNWLFGLGGKDWARPIWMGSSLDSHWLYQAVNFGYPGLIALLAANVAAIYAVARSQLARKDHLALRLGWIFTIVAFMVAGVTVDFWRAMNAYYFFILGSGMWLAEQSVRQPVMHERDRLA